MMGFDNVDNQHLRLVKAAALKLKTMGYRILSAECTDKTLKDVSEDELRFKITRKFGFRYRELARHDIVAEKDGKLLVVEVLTGKPSKQVAEAKRKAESVIVLFDVESGENIQVWGRREIKI
jgi:hypothetical protein